MAQIALIVHACDRYQLLFDGFYYFFKKNGGLDMPAKKYFLTEEITTEYEGFTNIKTQKGEWSNRLLRGLAQIEEPYVLYFQEDMWLDRPISPTFFTQISDFMAVENVKLLKLHSSEVYNTEGVGVFFEGLQLALLDNKKSDYLMSHQISLWDKKFLMHQLLPNEHPWRNERKATKRLKKLNEPLFQIDYFAENNNPPINQNRDETNRSRYFAVSANSKLYDTALPFIDILCNDLTTNKYGEKLKYHFENQLTHDGKAAPRKESWIKKLKNRFWNS